MSELPFHPIIQRWFRETFGEPTPPQAEGWPLIQQGKHTLIAAPTGSGKTLAAFLCCIDDLFRQALDGRLTDETQVVYVSPLKALSNDIERNLAGPLSEIQALAEAEGYMIPELRALVRTGDTPAYERQKMVKRPPHILVTTPESLYILLTSQRSRENLQNVRTLILDEIHAIADDKRGSHLTLTIERLTALNPIPPVRIGLSATQRPIELIANYLVGSPKPGTPMGEATALMATGREEALPIPDCAIVDGGHVRELDMAVETPPSPLSGVCSHEQWAEIYERLCSLVDTHRSTLIFVNTRKLAERVSYCLTQRLGEEAVASHHGSLSRDIRLHAESRLKSGELKVIVATASLELGIDIGYVDLVCQIASPKNIATFLQRVGRSGHSLGATPKGRLFPLTRDDLLECLSMVRAVRARRLDRIVIPDAPVDILAQQIIAEVASQEWDDEPLYEMVRRAWPYRNLTRELFDEVVDMVARGVDTKRQVGAYVYHDRINGHLKPRRAARLSAITAGGAIPDVGDFRVITEGEGAYVGTVNEDFAIESAAGDVFLLGNTSWMVRQVRNGEVVVMEVPGATPTIPFWFGESPGRSIELSEELSDLRREIASLLGHRRGESFSDAPGPNRQQAIEWVRAECGADGGAAVQAIDYVLAQLRAIGDVPTVDQILVERFFDETGGQQLVIHGPFGSRINRAWGLSLRKCFCRGFNFELQGSADENGVVLSLGLTHSFALEEVPRMLGSHVAQELLEQALMQTPIFLGRWRWNASRALAVLRFRAGKRVPPNLQRFRADDLLTGIFPEATACFEHIHGDIELPDHPLVNQSMHDALQEALDCAGLLNLLRAIEAGEVKAMVVETREPSPFSHELVNANVYAFLDDAPLEERRARAVSMRRTLNGDDLSDLARLDEGAIAQVRAEAWPVVRDAEELHDALLNAIALPAEEGGAWTPWFDELRDAGRAFVAMIDEDRPLWCATESWPMVRAIWPKAVAEPTPRVPASLDVEVEAADGWVALMRGRLNICGPIVCREQAEIFGHSESIWDSACSSLEGEGFAMRGRFTGEAQDNPDAPQEWCERRLLARIHRLTLDGLRRQIKPVPPEIFQRFLLARQHLTPERRLDGRDGLHEILDMLQGFDAPAGAWEPDIFASRLRTYDGNWLDELGLYGAVVWARFAASSRRTTENSRVQRINRAAPLAFGLRDDLDWLAAGSSTAASMGGDDSIRDRLHGHARKVLETLEQRGAMFFDDLLRTARLLPEQLEDALAELMGAGLATPDTFRAVRNFATPTRKSSSSTRRKRQQGRALRLGGRWSLFPAADLEAPADSVERWAWLLLRRYGVVCRDLLAAESMAPPWRALVPVLRQLEARGEIRGGRFISGFGGEQFAAPDVVKALRALRDAPDDNQVIVLPATDPANITALYAPDAKVASLRGNALALVGGTPVAQKQGKDITFLIELPPTRQAEIRKALQMTAIHRVHTDSLEAAADPQAAVPPASEPVGEGSETDAPPAPRRPELDDHKLPRNRRVKSVQKEATQRLKPPTPFIDDLPLFRDPPD